MMRVTDDATELPLSIKTALVNVGTPPVQLLAVVHVPVPPFHTDVCPKAGMATAKDIGMAKQTGNRNRRVLPQFFAI